VEGLWGFFYNNSAQYTMSALDLLAGGLANACSSSCLNIFDSAKTRIQLDQTGSYRSLPQALPKIYMEEGLKGLITPGIKAGVLREMSYSSFRFGAYTPARDFYNSIFNREKSSKDSSLIVKFLAAVSVGLFSSSLANPTDLVKIKLQAEHGVVANGKYTTGLRKGHAPVYQNTLSSFAQIYRREGGFGGLYRGVNATAIRAGSPFFLT
jgi:hypothetical protein